MASCKCLQYCVDRYDPNAITLIDILGLLAEIIRSTLKILKSYPDLLGSIDNTLLSSGKNPELVMLRPGMRLDKKVIVVSWLVPDATLKCSHA